MCLTAIVDGGDEAGVMWTIAYVAHLGLPRPTIVPWNHSQSSQDWIVKSVEGEGADAVISRNESVITAKLLAALREETPELLLVSGPTLVNDTFITLCAGSAPVLAIAPSQNEQTCATELQVASSSGNGLLRQQTPSQNECRTFDAADHLEAAIYAGSTSQQDVRQFLSSMERDIFGERLFERHHPARPVGVARITDGHWVFSVVTPGSAITEDSSP
ncbi:MAG: hypothetical protein HY287_02215 [Planctomycetes bacterium]|nr:hypothetical protein [Planctomycetota bacterium]MBI3833126.1 hypothetical protein [Planctomycetota bacterium]